MPSIHLPTDLKLKTLLSLSPVAYSTEKFTNYVFLIFSLYEAVIISLIHSTCRSRHLCYNHRAGSLSPPPCPGRSSGAGPQRRGGPHTNWEPGCKQKTQLPKHKIPTFHQNLTLRLDKLKSNWLLY